MTNYEKYFGTVEQAAKNLERGRYITAYSSWLVNMIRAGAVDLENMTDQNRLQSWLESEDDA